MMPEKPARATGIRSGSGGGWPSRVKKVAADLKMEIIPAVFPIGYSNDLLSNDPNLAEGLPVKDTPFVVKGDEARVVPDPALPLGKPSYADGTVKIDGGVATVHGAGGHHRFNYGLTLPPHRCYHVSVQIRTDDFTGTPEIKAIAGSQSLQFENLGVKRTQDWTTRHVVLRDGFE